MPAVDPNPPLSVQDIDRAPDFTGAVVHRAPEEQIPRLMDRIGSLSSENEELRDKLKEAKSNANTIKELDDLIKPYASRSFHFMCWYSGTVAAILLLQGSGLQGFNLSESVLNVLVGSTAVTVIGLVGMVLTGIFVGARRR